MAAPTRPECQLDRPDGARRCTTGRQHALLIATVAIVAVSVLTGRR